MSEASGLQHGPAMVPAGLMTLLEAPVAAPATDVQPHEVKFRRLLGHDIGQVLHLRKQIALPASALGDGGFAAREKKETKSASSGPSSATARP